MSKQPYHHGKLKEELVRKGIALLNSGGYESLSMRKLAELCGVSHTAAYKHFKSRDDLIVEITKEIMHEFAENLVETLKDYDPSPKVQLAEMGYQYVKFMKGNPEYMKFMFLGSYIEPIVIENGEVKPTEHNPFNIFKDSAIAYLKSIEAPEKYYAAHILTLWSLVHGLASLLVTELLVFNDDSDVYIRSTIAQFLSNMEKGSNSEN